MSVGMIEYVWDAIGVGGLVALGVLAQYGVVAWQQRWRESRLYRDTLQGTDGMPGSLDPTATTKELADARPHPPRSPPLRAFATR